MKTVHIIAFALVIIGALNWLLVAFNFNLVSTLVGAWPMVEKVVYILVGLSAIYLAVGHKKACKECAVSM